MLLRSLILFFLKVSLSNSYPLEKDSDGEMDCGSNLRFNNVWKSGGTGSLYVPIPTDVETWKVTLTFSSPVTHLQVWDGLNIECTGNICLFENQGYNKRTQLKIDFLIDMNDTIDFVPVGQASLSRARRDTVIGIPSVTDFVPDLVALKVNECVYIEENI